MAGLNYDRFVRVLTRCVELGEAAGKPPIIGLVYKQVAETKIKAFLTANTAVARAVTAFIKESREAQTMLAVMDQPYKVARSAVGAVLPETELPETLKSRPTDTDKLLAIEQLLDVIDDHAGTPWADELLQGDFGQKAPQTVKELNEAVLASTSRSEAITTRAEAFGLAHEAYLAFKRVVRGAMGPSSRDYRRIHLRASPGAADQDDMDGEPVQSTKAAGSEPQAPPPQAPVPETASPPPAGEEKKPA